MPVTSSSLSAEYYPAGLLFVCLTSDSLLLCFCIFYPFCGVGCSFCRSILCTVCPCDQCVLYERRIHHRVVCFFFMAIPSFSEAELPLQYLASSKCSDPTTLPCAIFPKCSYVSCKCITINWAIFLVPCLFLPSIQNLKECLWTVRKEVFL